MGTWLLWKCEWVKRLQPNTEITPFSHTHDICHAGNEIVAVFEKVSWISPWSKLHDHFFFIRLAHYEAKQVL